MEENMFGRFIRPIFAGLVFLAAAGSASAAPLVSVGVGIGIATPRIVAPSVQVVYSRPPSVVWIPGHWEQVSRHRSVFVPGHWRDNHARTMVVSRPAVAVAPAHAVIVRR